MALSVSGLQETHRGLVYQSKPRVMSWLVATIHPSWRGRQACINFVGVQPKQLCFQCSNCQLWYSSLYYLCKLAE